MPAKPLNLALSGMPQMSAAFMGWKTALTLSKITQSVSDGWVVNLEQKMTVQGTWQPLSPEEIKLKPEGQRSWEWIDLHIEGSTMLFQTNDRIARNGLLYKIMSLKDYTLNNFSEYHLIRDYENDDVPDYDPMDQVTYNGQLVYYLGEQVTCTVSNVTYQGEQVTYFNQPVTV